MDTAQKPETFHLTAEAAEALPHQAQIGLQQVDNLKYFLISAPVDWAPDQFIRRFLLPTGDYVSCVLWSNLFHISGTDIVRCLAFRFQAFGRPVKNAKKFEEGIFSDLRNLKAGTDASLEEPKSPFLDFLYKNNCIRTQKKQKVFYWYSVPHDRLFLDALERDLKREHAGQETTTVAESEPALSFDYDSSQSLFEQLTKTTPSKTSSDTPNHDGMPTNTSPSAGHSQQTVTSNAIPHMGGALNNFSYSDQAMPGALATTPMQTPMNYTMTAQTTNGGYYNPPAYANVGHHQMSYSVGSASSDVSHQRQNSMPMYYVESSPAPSFISNQSHYEDYSRAVSYEPVTPPQHGYSYAQDQFYPQTENINYSVSKADQFSTYDGVMPVHMPSAPQYRHSSVPRQYASNNAYSHIEGSPLYKQRRRNSSLAGYPAVGAMPPPTAKPTYVANRPSDLRRSVSASVVPQDHSQRASSGPPMSVGYMNELRSTPNASRHSSPMNEDGRSVSVTKRRYSSLVGDDFSSNATGALKRARSATVGEAAEHSQPKTHHCPIGGCGRAFGRLEHLKRHVRTHTQERPYQCDLCDKAFSRSDNLAQHKRTHEPNNDGSSLELVQEEVPLETDHSPSFVGDISQISVENYLSGSQLGANENHGFVMADYTFTSDMGGHYDTMGSMAPPPLPSHISGY